MKKTIHPKYFDKAKVHCVCGNNFTVGSTKEFLEVEVCSACHPFFTGKEKIMDTMGRVEKFRKRLEKKEEPKKKKEPKQKKEKQSKKLA
ncbi:MAG: 50S ribosomal protein L31 [Candidatus Pacebacteria bacterium]|nr:50S ribosomal protein L31 [Candidatus Paceibacterota bacterium]MDD3072280.1 50S ribosomal protein L31 [Candidatus Paceibacterota bacterium]MDD3728860.1 50S ribosomal protein L31 [Candidatus Paceibacterota bacterium]MDD4201797.1 50S ribosomal protein L31 [Candidatus Paceibacterota bacterium]MDD4467352.1 50S ribosomal protein L31 [Candidatus Paceibacterota bacterium]